MKADMDDMPEYLKTRKQENPWRMVVIMGLGTAVVVGAIGLFGGGFAERAQRIANGQSLSDDIGFMQPQPKQQERTRPQGVATTQQTYNPPQALRNEEPLIIERGKTMNLDQPRTAKQTVFNNQNYEPKGAINIIDARDWGDAVTREETRITQKKQQEIVIIGKEEPRLRDFCPYKPGTVEHRNCKMRMDLNSRN